MSYIVNPRVTENRVGDGTNVKKSQTEYWADSGVATYGLVKESRVYDTDLSTILKKSVTEYNLSSTYTNRRIIGLPSKIEAWGRDDVTNGLEYVSKVTFGYDEEDFTLESNQNISSVIRHDNTNYSASFVAGRGNLTSTTRHDVTGATSAVTSKIRYDIAGSPVAKLDPLNRKVAIEYADAFNDTLTTRNTYAYPTKLSDPAGNYSEVRYRFDLGANVWAKSPDLNTTTTGKETTRIFDTVGRILKETIVNSGAYTRYEYFANSVQSRSYSTIIDTNSNGADTADEVLSETWADGAGRTRRSRILHPGSTGGWSGTQTEYDILGRAWRTSVPTEISVDGSDNWTPAGDDAARGWIWNSQEFDWKGRVTRSIPSDSTGGDGKDTLISYEGCGCAGGQVTTIQGPSVPRDDQPNQTARRKQKVFEDILGRTWKTVAYKWDGSTPYLTTENSFNGRDQLINVVETDNTTSSPEEHHDTVMTYDGFGRLQTKHVPEQSTGAVTAYAYNKDNSISSVTDGRGISTLYGYNSRGLIDSIAYDDGSSQTTGASFSYNNVGLRTYMTDRLGTVSYTYDSLSRMTSETRDFNDYLQYAPSGVFTIGYQYDLSGGLKQITDPYGHEIDYTTDHTGRLKTVTGDSWAGNTNYVTNIDYRAFGGEKSVSYSNSVAMSTSYDFALRPNNFTVTQSNSTVLSKEFQYYQDGNIKFSGDSNNSENILNRAYRFDNMSRVSEATSGTEALGQTQQDPSLLPYRMTYSYNAFSNLLSSSGASWDGSPGHSATFTDNRVSGYNYDADGRITGPSTVGSNETSYTTYDLDGGALYKVEAYDPPSHVGKFERTFSQFRDGDGQLTKQTNYYKLGSVVQVNKTFYFIRSTVLGGKVLTEATTNGSKNRTFVFANEEVVAVQKGWIGSTWSPHTRWQYSDPSDASFRTLDASGDVQTDDSAELEPFGSNVGLEPESTGDPYNHVEYGPYASMGSPTTCLLDGLETNCNMVAQFLNSGVADRCPSDYCGVVRLTNGQNLWGSYLAGYFGQNQDERASRGKATRARKKTAERPTLKKRASPRRTPEQRRIQRAIETSGVFDNESNDVSDVDPPDISNLWQAFGRALRLGNLLVDRVKILGFTDEQQTAILDSLRFMIMSNQCAKAFRKANLQIPAEVIRDRGVVFAHNSLLQSASNNKDLGMSNRVRDEMFRRQTLRSSGFTVFELPGPVYTVFTDRSFTGNDFPVSEIMVHERIHGSSVGPQYSFWGWISGDHDLTGYDHYDEILKNCRRPEEP